MRTLWVIVALLIFALAPRARAASQLLLNGDLSKGSENQPDDWRMDAWVNDPSAVSFFWNHPLNGGPGEAEVVAIKENDARWLQSLSLPAGWYHITGEIRTENVGNDKIGANISVMDDSIMSIEIKGTTGWTPVELYFRVGSKGSDIDVALRVGGFGSLNTGKAFFRDVAMTPVAAPPPNAQQTFDLEKIRQAGQPAPIGKPFSMVVTYLFLLGVAYVGWYLYALEPAQATRISRAEARREARKKAARR
jgi:dolichyl-phosphate-mannose-protein mannosyltransferase